MTATLGGGPIQGGTIIEEPSSGGHAALIKKQLNEKKPVKVAISTKPVPVAVPTTPLNRITPVVPMSPVYVKPTMSLMEDPLTPQPSLIETSSSSDDSFDCAMSMANVEKLTEDMLDMTRNR